MAQTANYNLEKPDTETFVDAEFYKLQGTLDLLDSILAALQTAVNGKSATGHTHAISDVINLASELAAKMPASTTFKLDDLTDVSGADGAPNNYVLVKSALGWLPSSALAALGTHGHLISEITGLVDALAGKADAAATTTALAGKAALLSSGTSDNVFDDTDELPYVTGTTQKRGTFAGLIASIFNGTRAIANGVFLAASFAWQNAGGHKRTHDITGQTADWATNWPNGVVTIPAGTLVSEANGGISKGFETPQQIITVGGTLTIAHGLGVRSKDWAAWLVCTTAEGGYSVGEFVAYPLTSTGTNRCVSVIVNATNIIVRFGSNAPIIGNATTGADFTTTPANWRFVFGVYA